VSVIEPSYAIKRRYG